MVATDTVVGIVGAILLVGVMAGVFVYEYNNVEVDDGGGGGDGGGTAAMIDPDGDLDADGVANGVDDDIDGDGIPNDEDDATEITFSWDGSIDAGVAIGPLPGDGGMHAFPVEMGGASIAVEWSFDGVDPVGVASGISVALHAPNDDEADTGSGASGTLTASKPAAGTWEFTIDAAMLNLGGSYTAVATVTY